MLRGMMIGMLLLGILGIAPAWGKMTIQAQPNLFENRAVIDISAITAVLEKALQEKEPEGDHDIMLRDLEKGLLLEDTAREFTLEVKSLELTPYTGQFAAIMQFTSPHAVHEKKLEGTYAEVVEVPVLARRVARDTPITKEDVHWIKVVKQRLPAGAVLKEKDILGLVLRRSFPLNRPIRERDLEKPEVISRNEVVRLVYSTPTMQLHVTAVALESGAEGDVIRLRNTESNRIIRGVIQNDRNVAAVASAMM